MDQDLIAQIDASLSRVGAEKVWKRKIGDVTLWLAPITLAGQERVTSTMAKADDLGPNVIHEVKRVTLAFSIVGFDEIDLRPYRDGLPILPLKGKDGKTTKVSLDKFLQEKMQFWSMQLIDDAYAVYGDLLESLQKENLKEIKFENAKDPREELKEIEARAAELRLALGMPQLVEQQPAVMAVDGEPASDGLDEPADAADEVSVPDFDPFAKVSSLPVRSPSVDAAALAPEHRPPQATSAAQTTVIGPDGHPVVAYRPPATQQIVEEPHTPARVAPPVIDAPQGTRNPRFSGPTR